MAASKQFAAGVIIYDIDKNDNIVYLLLKASYPPYHWTPPKGLVDDGETQTIVTALREVEEETGFTAEDLELKDFEKTIDYDVKGKRKFVTYYLAKLQSEKTVTISDEHVEFVWVDCDHACDLIGRNMSTTEVMIQCQQFLRP